MSKMIIKEWSNGKGVSVQTETTEMGFVEDSNMGTIKKVYDDGDYSFENYNSMRDLGRLLLDSGDTPVHAEKHTVKKIRRTAKKMKFVFPNG